MHFRNWYICVVEDSCTLNDATPRIYLEEKLNERKKERVLHGFWLKRFITVLQFDRRTKIGSLLTLFFRRHWDEVGNMLVSNAVYRAAKHINSSSLPVSWHIVKIVALNQSDFPKEQNVQSKQKHPCSVHTSHDSHQRICVPKFSGTLNEEAVASQTLIQPCTGWREWEMWRFLPPPPHPPTY